MSTKPSVILLQYTRDQLTNLCLEAETQNDRKVFALACVIGWLAKEKKIPYSFAMTEIPYIPCLFQVRKDCIIWKMEI